MRRIGIYVTGLALVLISAGFGIGWVGLAAYAWLKPLMHPAWAALLVAGLLFLPCLLLFIVHAISRQAERAADARYRLMRRRNQPTAARVVGQLQELFDGRPMVALLVSLAAGAVIARYPRAAAGMVKLLGRAAR